MANKQGKKCKKPLQTSLGRAPNQNQKEVDLSQVQKPIHTSIFGLPQVLALFETATPEVKDYITYECDLIYECRMCRTIFRSFANFILHKRSYCKERFHSLALPLENINVQEQAPSKVVDEESNNLESRLAIPVENDNTSNKNLMPVIDKLKEKQRTLLLTQEILNQDLSIPEKQDDNISRTKLSNEFLLEDIPSNKAAVFQTVLQKIPEERETNEFMRSEVMEIHSILDSNEAILGPDGKICDFKTKKFSENSAIIPKQDLICTVCNLKFSTKKTLTYHVKCKHNNTRLVYVCPDCKITMANPWSVYRHLLKIHRRTSDHIKRMRDQINVGVIRKDHEPIKKKDQKQPEKLDKTDDENQWMNNIEGDNDFQMCGGCGKRFERKAALYSHAQMCTKRMAVCNHIKETKKREEESKDNKNKVIKLDKPKGASKRKPYLLRNYKQGKEKITLIENIKNMCDVNANTEIVRPNCDNNTEIELNNAELKANNVACQNMEEIHFKTKVDDNSVLQFDQMDTDKLLNIIGIKSNGDYKVIEKTEEESVMKNSENHPKEHIRNQLDIYYQTISERANHKFVLNTDNGLVPLDKILRENALKSDKIEQRSGTNEKNKKIQIENNMKPEIFCDNQLAQLLEKTQQPNAGKSETEDNPLKNNLKIETVSVLPLRDQITPDKDAMIVENIDEISYASDNTQQTPLSLSAKISVRSLEELMEVSPKDHEKLKNNDACTRKKLPFIKMQNQELFENKIHKPSFEDISGTVKAHISPTTLRKNHPKAIKRRRTSTFDQTKVKKTLKFDNSAITDEQDEYFIKNAAPYIDESKLLCIPCQVSYATLPKLLWHMSAHFSWFRFQCSRCSFISFSKSDCTEHAITNHNVRKSAISSVVLQIPNWKRLLMSHNFCEMDDNEDLKGKHTDEVMIAEEIVTTEDNEEPIESTNDVQVVENLFLDSESIDFTTHTFPLPIVIDEVYAIKNESIDIDEAEAKESFQIERPDELYEMDVFGVISVPDNDNDRCQTSPPLENQKGDDNEEEDLEKEYYIPNSKENHEAVVDPTVAKELPQLLHNVENKVYDVPVVKDNPNIAESVLNIRPTRNRMRSVKTFHRDFCYDLKATKQNDTAATKKKKTVNSAQRKSKNCNSKKMRDYSKTK